jgi:LuxR family quorum sensing-dependent transcriptional regulator
MQDFSHTEAWAFIRAAPNYRSAAELEAHFARVLEAFGFDRYACSRLDGPNSMVSLSSKGLDSWDEHRLEQGYLEVDPCAAWIGAGRPSFAWGEARAWSERNGKTSPKERTMWDEAASDGMKGGLIVSAPGPSGHLLITRIMTGARDIRPVDRPILDGLSVIFSTLMLRLYEQAHDRPLNAVLTQREVECLRWAGGGLTDMDIGERLGISRRTVNNHIENAKRKLAAPNRLAAYKRAHDLGLLGAE